jgi:hypothetical protein
VLKPKVYDQENLCGIPLTFIKVKDKSWPTFGHSSVHEQKLTELRQYLNEDDKFKSSSTNQLYRIGLDQLL